MLSNLWAHFICEEITHQQDIFPSHWYLNQSFTQNLFWMKGWFEHQLNTQLHNKYWSITLELRFSKYFTKIEIAVLNQLSFDVNNN